MNIRKKPTQLFLAYVVQLAFRLALFGYGVYLFASNPEALDIRARFGLAHGFDFVDFAFLAILADFATKFFRRAKISMGSLKQYRLYYQDKTPATSAAARAILGRDRAKETVPVAIAWIALNAAVASLLGAHGLLTQEVALVWCLFFFVFDMVCVVIWCPIQVVLMRNRCCTTCQIFNWDAIMVATPAFFIGGWFGGVLIALALVVLVRWELAALRHPERFDERTNARLACANCKDQLCYLRPPLRRPMPKLPENI